MPADGTLTPEYKAFHRNCATLTEAIKNVLPKLALKLHAENLIGDGNRDEALNPYGEVYTRASNVIGILLSRISFDKTEFYKVGHIMSTIPVLWEKVKDIFPPQQGTQQQQQPEANAQPQAQAQPNPPAQREEPQVHIQQVEADDGEEEEMPDIS